MLQNRKETGADV